MNYNSFWVFLFYFFEWRREALENVEATVGEGEKDERIAEITKKLKGAGYSIEISIDQSNKRKKSRKIRILREGEVVTFGPLNGKKTTIQASEKSYVLSLGELLKPFNLEVIPFEKGKSLL